MADIVASTSPTTYVITHSSLTVLVPKVEDILAKAIRCTGHGVRMRTPHFYASLDSVICRHQRRTKPAEPSCKIIEYFE